MQTVEIFECPMCGRTLPATMMSDIKATYTGSPDYTYDLCQKCATSFFGSVVPGKGQSDNTTPGLLVEGNTHGVP